MVEIEENQSGARARIYKSHASRGSDGASLQ